MSGSAERWSWLFLTLIMLACIWFLFRRAQLVITRAENTEDRADQILDRCDEFTEWLWKAHRQQQPETAPMERVSTDTVETGRVIDEGMDDFLAAARARWAEIAAAPVGKPAAKARRSQV